MGLKCGYHLWLFGIFSSIFLPYAMPNMSKRQRRQIGIYGIIIVVTFELLTLFDRIGIMPNAYEVPDRVARVMYYINASVGFCSIMIYTSFYNNRMAFKNKELVKAANFDFLTGVFNRQRMQTILSGETERAQNIDDSRLAVAILDIDFFKNINDTYGHKAGDDALMQISDIFREKEKEGLLFGRWGGEEFLLISPENISYEQFGNLLEDIRKTVEEHDFSTGKDSIKLTVSIGAVAFEKGMSAEKLVHIADDRLYEAKASGRNRVICK
jgi:diguanylate cyclase (GGDEF)-like protein